MKFLKIALLTVLFTGAVTIPGYTQTQVYVPGTASGNFGAPTASVPFVPAITVSGPATITVTYISGTVTDCCGIVAGPTGVTYNAQNWQWPLQEAIGIAGGWINNEDALIGAFVPAVRAGANGFNPVDGTKDTTRVGIMPNTLFFIGTGKTFSVTQAGTLYLGINDINPGDNGGGFNVTVSVE